MGKVRIPKRQPWQSGRTDLGALDYREAAPSHGHVGGWIDLPRSERPPTMSELDELSKKAVEKDKINNLLIALNRNRGGGWGGGNGGGSPAPASMGASYHSARPRKPKKDKKKDVPPQLIAQRANAGRVFAGRH